LTQAESEGTPAKTKMRPARPKEIRPEERPRNNRGPAGEEREVGTEA